MFSCAAQFKPKTNKEFQHIVHSVSFRVLHLALKKKTIGGFVVFVRVKWTECVSVQKVSALSKHGNSIISMCT